MAADFKLSATLRGHEEDVSILSEPLAGSIFSDLLSELSP